jgi:hypothetical protein
MNMNQSISHGYVLTRWIRESPDAVVGTGAVGCDYISLGGALVKLWRAMLHWRSLRVDGLLFLNYKRPPFDSFHQTARCGTLVRCWGWVFQKMRVTHSNGLLLAS